MAAARAVELGFVQEAEAWRLRSAQFPSKAGGRPAWLGEVGVPGTAEMQCGVCGNPLAFLLQVYAPCAGNFHRTLLLFCCRRASCHRSSENRCFTVFRSQLPRKNNTYPYDPPPETPSPDGADCNIFQLKSGLHLCLVCGCLGPKACARCHKAHYCSKEHQTTDWKLQHKKLCGEESNASSAAVPNHGFLFPEYEIVTEPEELDSDTRSQDEEEDAEVVTSAVIESCVGGLDEQELEAMAKHETKDDMVFNSFKRRIALEPEQVLRYCRGGEPLWISHQNVPAEEEIPNCPCGAKRIFEFQVMPQLLNHLKVDSLGESIDWGILAVFTCTDNCTTETRYAVEFLWKQDIVGDTM